MSSSRTKTFLLFFTVVFVTFVLDAVSKVWAANTLSTTNLMGAVPGLISFVRSYNVGAAFSLAQGFQALFILLFLVVFVGSVVFLYFYPNSACSLTFGIALMCGGGLGNALNRLVSGSVLDFIRLDFLHFPIFNIADVCLSVGFIIICVCVIRSAFAVRGNRDA